MNTERKLSVRPILACAGFALLTFAYLLYAVRAWFHQDDFVFIDKFSDHLHLSELIALEGFGRFVTQNLYWFVGLDVLGRHSEIFFFVNFLTICASSLIVYVLIREVLDAAGAVTASFMYFSLPWVVHGYAWISNSQHLVAHLFCFAFVTSLLRKKDSFSWRDAGISLGLFLLAVGSNSFGVALCAVLLWQIFDPRNRSSLPFRVLMSACSLVTLVVFVRARSSAVGAYEVDVSVETFATNARFYFDSMFWFFSWMGACVLATIVLTYRQRIFEASLFLCSLAFYVPFAFLEFQRYPQYGVMTMIFFLMGSWTVLYRFLEGAPKWAGSVVTSLVIFGFVTQGLQEFSKSLDEPTGSQAWKLVTDLRKSMEFEEPSTTKYCFDAEPVLDDQGAPTSLAPAPWWWVGHGLAFEQFVDGSKSYQLLSQSDDCERVYFISTDSVYRVR